MASLILRKLGSYPRQNSLPRECWRHLVNERRFNTQSRRILGLVIDLCPAEYSCGPAISPLIETGCEDRRNARRLCSQVTTSSLLFLSERRQPLSRFTVCSLINKYAAAAGLEQLAIHPHVLRHACGYSLANRGTDTRLIQDYLGKNIQHTVRYTKLLANRLSEESWKD